MRKESLPFIRAAANLALRFKEANIHIDAHAGRAHFFFFFQVSLIERDSWAPECGFAFIYSIDRELYLGASTPPGVAAIDFQSRAFSWHLIKLQLHVQEGAAGTTDRFHIPIYVGPMHLCQPIPCVWSEEYARLVGLWRKTAPRPTENVGE